MARARQLFLNLRKPNPHFPVATVACLREANTAFLQCTEIGTLRMGPFSGSAFFNFYRASSSRSNLKVFVIAMLMGNGSTASKSAFTFTTLDSGKAHRFPLILGYKFDMLLDMG